DDFDAVMLMGDADAKILWNNKDVHRIIKRALKRKKVIGAIGAASVTLVNADASLLDKKITTDEAYAKYIIEKKAKYTGKDIQDDGLIVTTAGFKKKVVKEFLNKFRAVIKANE
ncbi:MAG: DJ-1/PfpI family protein, partial [Planctomycetes bacterium]|nr:DJ-1/PfpI family protein [Planctomycetota bacterium]